MPLLRIPPPSPSLLPPFAIPFEIVRPEIITVLLVISKIRKGGELVIRRTVTRWAKGPVIVRFLSMNNSSLLRLTFVTLGAKSIVSPGEALRIACRNEPAPLSCPFVTVIVDACASVAPNKSAAATQGRKKRQHLNKYRLRHVATRCKWQTRTTKVEHETSAEM